MHCYGLSDAASNLFAGIADGNAPWKIRNVCAPCRGSRLVDDSVVFSVRHGIMPSVALTIAFVSRSHYRSRFLEYRYLSVAIIASASGRPRSRRAWVVETRMASAWEGAVRKGSRGAATRASSSKGLGRAGVYPVMPTYCPRRRYAPCVRPPRRMRARVLRRSGAASARDAGRTA